MSFSHSPQAGPGCPFDVLASGAFRRGDIHILYERGARVVRSHEEQDLIALGWAEAILLAKQHGTPMFNGRLFRMKDWRTDADALTIGLGDTDYCEYVGTRVPEFYLCHSRPSLANPLAVCIALITNDGNILVERRQHVDAYCGLYHVIGGFIDPELDIVDARPDPFAAIQRELNEETGIIADETSLRAVGLVYDVTTPHPNLCFTAATGLTLAEVKNHHDRNNSEVVELEGVELSEESVHEFLRRCSKEVSATGAGCLALVGRQLYGEVWYREVIQTLIT
jgi:8-oxo-dGTP pyrophosphatase MutT (NUDIX family)